MLRKIVLLLLISLPGWRHSQGFFESPPRDVVEWPPPSMTVAGSVRKPQRCRRGASRASRCDSEWRCETHRDIHHRASAASVLDGSRTRRACGRLGVHAAAARKCHRFAQFRLLAKRRQRVNWNLWRRNTSSPRKASSCLARVQVLVRRSELHGFCARRLRGPVLRESPRRVRRATQSRDWSAARSAKLSRRFVTSLRQTGLDNVLDEGDDAAPGFRDGASATAAVCALFVALWAWVAGSDPRRSPLRWPTRRGRAHRRSRWRAAAASTGGASDRVRGGVTRPST